MPKSISLFRIFVASPSDTKQEREALERIVSQLNLTLANSHNARIELIKWETHASPGFGQDPQDVINNSMPDDYDIFIGIMWGRFGSLTNRAGSGTEEEFLNAYKRFKNKGDVKIMFYFNNFPIPVDEIDPDQISKMKEFKNSLGEKGGLYWDYNDLDEFENFVRMHITSAIDSSSKTSVISRIDVRAEDDEKLEIFEQEDELGMIEYIELAEDAFVEIQDSSQRMTHLILEIGDKMSDRTDEINQMTSSGNVTRNEAKLVVDRAASDMLNFVSRIKTEIPIFKDATTRGFNYYSKGLTLSNEYQRDPEELTSRLKEVTDLKSTLVEAQNAIVSFQKAIIAWPALTTRLVKAKRDSVNALRRLVIEFKASINTLDELENSISKRLE